MESKKQRQFRHALVLAQEASEPEAWWWFSFSSPSGWLGGANIKCRGIASGLMIATLLGINPGGEVMAVKLLCTEEEFEEMVPLDLRHRLLSKSELEAAGGLEKIPSDLGECACEACNRR
jgi:hypothetical protein